MQELFASRCPGDCNGSERGVCNFQLGECRCRLGFKGESKPQEVNECTMLRHFMYWIQQQQHGLASRLCRMPVFYFYAASSEPYACSNAAHCADACTDLTCSCHCAPMPAHLSGSDCSEDDVTHCNRPSTAEFPLGRWIASICPAHCNRRTGHCLCGSSTAFPFRPVPPGCGLLPE